MSRRLREESRQDYGPPEGRGVQVQDLGAGALLRIADSVERMTTTWDEMRRAQIRANRLQAEVNGLGRTVAGLRGALTRARKRGSR